MQSPDDLATKTDHVVNWTSAAGGNLIGGKCNEADAQRHTAPALHDVVDDSRYFAIAEACICDTWNVKDVRATVIVVCEGTDRVSKVGNAGCRIAAPIRPMTTRTSQDVIDLGRAFTTPRACNT